MADNNFINLGGGGGGGGVGTVTSVGMTVPASILSVMGSPITGSGTFAVDVIVQNANKVWAGPTTGADANPTFRALVAADIPTSLLYTLFATGVQINTSDKTITAGSSTNMLFGVPTSGSYTFQVNSLTRLNIENTGLKFPGTIALGTATSDNSFFYLPSVNFNTTASSTGYLMNLNANITGSNTGRNNYGLGCFIDGSSTAVNYNVGARVNNNVPGAGANFASNQGNFGGVFECQGSTSTGHNCGAQGFAFTGKKNVGLMGQATSAGTTGTTNIGVQGNAASTNSTLYCGGIFSIAASPSLEQTPPISAALLCSNLDTTDVIFAAYDNATQVFKVDDGGVVTIGPSGGSAVPVLNGVAATPASDVLTLTNGPSSTAGNPDIYFKFNFNGTAYWVPGWAV